MIALFRTIVVVILADILATEAGLPFADARWLMEMWLGTKGIGS